VRVSDGLISLAKTPTTAELSVMDLQLQRPETKLGTLSWCEISGKVPGIDVEPCNKSLIKQ